MKNSFRAFICVLILGLTLGVLSCRVKLAEPLTEAATAISGRFKIEKMALFDDISGYNSTRSMYLITDTKTGKEFLGVSQMGLIELEKK